MLGRCVVVFWVRRWLDVRLNLGMYCVIFVGVGVGCLCGVGCVGWKDCCVRWCWDGVCGCCVLWLV